MPVCHFDCKGGIKMTFKRTIPYFLTSAAMMLGISHTMGSTDGGTLPDDAQTRTATTQPVPNKTAHADTTYVLAAANINTSKIIDAVAHRYDVVYTRADGNQFRRSGGTRAWRNNNPGCLRYSEFTAAQGAIGKAGGFAVFPDEETGMRAICALLQSDGYRNLTISQAIFKYAPPHENDTDGYKTTLRRLTGLDISVKLSSLTPDQIMRVARAIKVVEGWRTGRETVIPTKMPPQDTIDLYAAAKTQMVRKSMDRSI